MNKNQLVSAIATKANCSKEVAQDCCDALVETIMEALKEGDKVALAGFGTFEMKVRARVRALTPLRKKRLIFPNQRQSISRLQKISKKFFNKENCLYVA